MVTRPAGLHRVIKKLVELATTYDFLRGANARHYYQRYRADPTFEIPYLMLPGSLVEYVLSEKEREILKHARASDFWHLWEAKLVVPATTCRYKGDEKLPKWIWRYL
jgi:hypothetical protein